MAPHAPMYKAIALLRANMPILFLFFILMPIVEMWVLIEVGSRIGAISTIALVCLTAFVGLGLLRQGPLLAMGHEP